MTTFSSEVLMALLVAVTKYDKEELRKGWAVRILRDSHLKAEKKIEQLSAHMFSGPSFRKTVLETAGESGIILE
jgi:hypothetical protein